MRKLLIAGAAVLALAGSTAVYAQYRPDHHFHRPFSRMSADDMSAFSDARIAAVKAGLKLTADQEKLWPPVEAAVRDFAKLRIDRARASVDRRDVEDPVARLRERADRMAANAAALKKVVDAADPLYKTLDESQKRRLMRLTRMGGHGWGHHGHRERGGPDGFGPGRHGGFGPGGYERDGGGNDGSRGPRGPERL